MADGTNFWNKILMEKLKPTIPWLELIPDRGVAGQSFASRAPSAPSLFPLYFIPGEPGKSYI